MTRDFVTNYGGMIESHLRNQEKRDQIKGDHLAFHEVRASFRAKMVDWMTEVMNIAF